MMTVQKRQKKLLKELDLSGLDSWMPKNIERAKVLVEFHDVFTLKEDEMG